MRIVFLHPDLGLGGAERLIVDAAVAMKQKVCLFLFFYRGDVKKKKRRYYRDTTYVSTHHITIRHTVFVRRRILILW